MEKELIMAWTTPTLVEICVGLEINGFSRPNSEVAASLADADAKRRGAITLRLAAGHRYPSGLFAEPAVVAPM
jgi:coenzyme PQQ precursor peptide PqqA